METILKSAVLAGLAFGFIVAMPLPASASPELSNPNAAPPIRLTVDATSITRRVVHSHLFIPANPGPLTLYYPQWVPGAHGPNGPIGRIAGLKLHSGGKPIPWKRDLVNLFSFHCDVPRGAHEVEAELLYAIPPVPPVLDVSLGVVASSKLAIINWNALVLYPAGAKADEVIYQARLKLPPTWKAASPLPNLEELKPAVQTGEMIESGPTFSFALATLYRLVDSPVLAGAHLKTYSLKLADKSPHSFDVAVEHDDDKPFDPEFQKHLAKLADEAGALFGARHYRSFRHMLAFSDKIPSFALEHHECTVNAVSPRAMTGDAQARWWTTFLMAHEYVHSWDGKYRRPAEMINADYRQPQKTELLWVYEGLTQYLGLVLDARSGFWSPEQFRDELAFTAANMDRPSARTWRPVLDTAIAAPLAVSAQGQSWRGQSDFYYEGALIWLEADVRIRQATNGHRSLDDFCRLFFGPQKGDAARFRHEQTTAGGKELRPLFGGAEGGMPTVKGYDAAEVFTTLNEVAPEDWQSFFNRRLMATSERAPLGGIEESGWKMVYTDTPMERLKNRQGRDLGASLGLVLSDTGAITDVLHDGLAAKAGLNPGMRVLRVGGQTWSPDAMREAMKKAKAAKQVLELTVDDDGTAKSYKFDYYGGERFAHLERDAGKPDLLTEIIKPKSK
jgi:predicted metalloprotease with PDZ domain